MLDIKNKLDVREISLYKDRFLDLLPATRRSTTDFTRPVFTAVAFYLCVKMNTLKVDRIKWIELCGTSESEFSSVSISMKDICCDVFGLLQEKKEAEEVKGRRELLDVLCEKRRYEDGGYLSDEDKEVQERPANNLN